MKKLIVLCLMLGGCSFSADPFNYSRPSQESLELAKRVAVLEQVIAQAQQRAQQMQQNEKGK